MNNMPSITITNHLNKSQYLLCTSVFYHNILCEGKITYHKRHYQGKVYLVLRKHPLNNVQRYVNQMIMYYIYIKILYIYMYISIYIYYIYIYIYIELIIGHYTVFHALVPIISFNLPIFNLFSFLKKQKCIYQSKSQTISQVIRNVQSKSKTYCLNKRFNISYYFII